MNDRFEDYLPHTRNNPTQLGDELLMIYHSPYHSHLLPLSSLNHSLDTTERSDVEKKTRQSMEVPVNGMMSADGLNRGNDTPDRFWSVAAAVVMEDEDMPR
jgi:hypothetical protein